MRNGIRSRRGFTLIELLVVVAIIGLIAAMLIPGLMDSIQKAKQKRTIADQRNIGSAWMSWLTDQVQAAAAGQGQNSDWPFGISNPNYPHADLQRDLDGSSLLPSGQPAPVYLAQVAERDAWGVPFIFALNEGNYLATHVMAIYSSGRDGAMGNAITFCNDDSAVRPGNHGYFDTRRYDCDLVWKDGFFVQAPTGLASLTGT